MVMVPRPRATKSPLFKIFEHAGHHLPGSAVLGYLFMGEWRVHIGASLTYSSAR